MSKKMITIFNIETGEEVTRELTEEEISSYDLPLEILPAKIIN